MSAALTTNVDQRLLRTTKFPPEFNVKVDMRKVNIQLIKAWASEEIERILKNDDDVVTELVSNILDESRYPNIKELQISLTGFLDKDAATFCTALWKLCLSAQDSPHGVPKELLEAKKAELARAKAEEDKQRELVMKRQEAERERDRELARIRERERNERNDRGRGRGGRYSGYPDRPQRDSRSPPRRRRDDDDYRRPPPRGADTYVPSKARDDDRPPRRRRSPSYGRSSSRSPSPPPRRRRRNTSSEPSRSPPRRRRRYSSSDERSRSRDRHDRRSGRHRRDERRRISRSPVRRRRSPSPRRDRRRSPPPRSRSPPAKRSRKASPSPARPLSSNSDTSVTSPKSQSPRKKAGTLAPNDLMSSKRNRDAHRLSREATETSLSRSQTPVEMETVRSES